MYKIIGADQKEYGPVSADQLRQWIIEGRVNGQTPLQAAGTTDWKPLAMFPEFADAISASRSGPIPPPMVSDYGTLPADIEARDYNLDIGHCIGRAWTQVMGNFWGVMGAMLIYFLLQLAVNVLSRVPLLGILIALAAFVLAGPMMGGVYSYLIRHIRGQPTQLGDIFAGFGPRIGHLILTTIIQALIGGVVAIPGVIVAMIGLVPLFKNNQPEPFQIMMIVLGAFIAMIPLLLLRVIWIFSLPLVIDKQLDFWPAMELSRKIVFKHFFVILAFLIVVGLLSAVGVVVCCVGVTVSATIGWLAMMYAYEDIFGHRKT